MSPALLQSSAPEAAGDEVDTGAGPLGAELFRPGDGATDAPGISLLSKPRSR